MAVPGWRLLGLFWACMLGSVVAAGGVLALLGPPVPARSANSAHLYHGANNAWPGPPPRLIGAAIRDPDPLLLEPAPHYPGAFLPRIAPSGRRPDHTYAAFSNAADPAAKVALIVSGIGLDRSDSMNAVHSLPAAVDLAISAYADEPARLLAAIRAAGHEYLLSLPMEPQGYPSDDEGDHQLLTTANPAENARNLEWSLSRIPGYVGVTGASDGQRGERYAASPALMEGVATELTARGLFYVDPRPQADPPEQVIGRSIDLVVDETAGADEIDSKLAELVQAAHLHGSAVGLLGQPSPVAIDRIVAWNTGLTAAGISLIPVSALMQPAAHVGP